MSFGFGIGDFIAVGELCWKLYSQVYKVSRDAPEELRGLNQELGNLHNTIQLLVEELKDEDSVLKRSGDVRINLVNRVMSQSEETLKKMQELSKRYAELQTPAKGQGQRLNPRIYWDRLKYSQELHTINDLRAKIMLHNSQLALTLQGAQNSSLERIEKQNTQTDKKLDELRQLLVSDRALRDRPMLTAPLDANALMELTDAFLQKAEFDNRPWASIGIDSWLQISQWWLMKAESQLGVAPKPNEYNATHNQGYINLLKACWILTDIIAIHPQRTHMGASNDRRAYHIQRLTQGATSKLNTLSTITLQLKDLLACNLDIWNLPPSTAFTPRRRNTGDQLELKWQTRNGDILFQKFAEYQDDGRDLPVECIVIIVMPSEQFMDALSLNLIVQNSMGRDIYKRRSTSNACNDSSDAKDPPIRFFAQQDKRLLDCILKSLLVFRHSPFAIQQSPFAIQQSPKPFPTDASIIYSAALLHACVGARKAVLKRSFPSSTINEDINILTRSREELQITPTTHASVTFQLIVDRIVEYIKQCSERFPTESDRQFWMQNNHCIWMLTYWLCDTFETFSTLFEAIRSCSLDFYLIDENCLIRSSLLRNDMEFLQKFVSYLDMKGKQAPNTAILLIAIHNDDIAALTTAIRNTQGNSEDWIMAWEFAYTHFKWDTMDVLLSAPDLDPLYFLLEALCWLVKHHKRDELQFFLDFIQQRAKNLVDNDSRPFLYDTYSGHSHARIVHSCTKLIYDGSLHDLELFFNILRKLGVISWAFHRNRAQLAIIPALASQKLSILRFLFEKDVVTSYNVAISLEHFVCLEKDYILTGRPFLDDFSILEISSPLPLAIAFVLDLEIVEYICRTGARLRKALNDTDSDEPKTLRKLRLTTSVTDARIQNCYIKGIDYHLCFVKKEIRELIGNLRNGPLAKTWVTIGRIIFEGDCRHLYNIADVYSGLTWQAIQNKLYPGKLKDAPIPMATSWPAPLSTQESWDNWRLKVIAILEEFESLKS